MILRAARIQDMRVSILGEDTGYCSRFCSVAHAKCLDSAPTRPRGCPFKHFAIHHSSVIRLFYVVSCSYSERSKITHKMADKCRKEVKLLLRRDEVLRMTVGDVDVLTQRQAW